MDGRNRAGDQQLAVLRWLHDNAPVSEELVVQRVRSSPVADLDLDELLCLYRRLGLLTRVTRPDGSYLDTTATVESVVARASTACSDGAHPADPERLDQWDRELK